jgi:hypothetical protein
MGALGASTDGAPCAALVEAAPQAQNKRHEKQTNSLLKKKGGIETHDVPMFL